MSVQEHYLQPAAMTTPGTHRVPGTVYNAVLRRTEPVLGDNFLT